MLPIQQKIAGFCDLTPPGINNIISFVVNLPLIMLWIITVPPRFFLCTITSITQIPLLGLLANIFPPITMFCSVVPGSSYACFSNCPNCIQSNECVSIPESYAKFCQETRPYFSIFNQIFCLIGYILVVMSIPIITLVNIVLAFFGKQICVDLNPNNCIPQGG